MLRNGNSHRMDTVLTDYEHWIVGCLRFICVDCKTDTSPLGLRQYYMVNDEVWEQSGMGKDDGMLCLLCLEARIGRDLKASDFTNIPMNKEWLEYYG